MPAVRRKSPTIAPVSLELEEDASLDHHARLALPIAAAAKGQAGGGAVRQHIRQLLPNKPNALLIGRGEGHRPGGTARAIKQVRCAVLYRAARVDVFGPAGNADVVVDRVARQDRAAIGRGVMTEAERRAAASAVVCACCALAVPPNGQAASAMTVAVARRGQANKVLAIAV